MQPEIIFAIGTYLGPLRVRLTLNTVVLLVNYVFVMEMWNVAGKEKWTIH